MLLSPYLEQLAAFEPTQFPVISLYLDTQTDQHGRTNFDTFIRKEFPARAKTYPQRSPERESFDRDTARIEKYLREELRPATKGLAIFACAGAGDFFRDVQLDAPLEENRLYIYDQPYLYDLARLDDEYPRYAALIADTNSARLFVFGLHETLEKGDVTNPKVKRTSVGGWSQARFQRHVENYHLHHAKEVVEALDRVVRQEKIEHVILAGDEVIIPTLRDQLPPHLNEKVIDVLRLDIKTPEHEVLRATLETMREQDAKDDAEKVARMIDQYRAGGLAVAGAPGTLAALEKGQVDELLLSASLQQIHGGGTTEPDSAVLADSLVKRAQQTGARVTFIEDPALLADFGGIGAMLRYRV